MKPTLFAFSPTLIDNVFIMFFRGSFKIPFDHVKMIFTSSHLYQLCIICIDLLRIVIFQFINFKEIFTLMDYFHPERFYLTFSYSLFFTYRILLFNCFLALYICKVEHFIFVTTKVMFCISHENIEPRLLTAK